jgi:sugar phosphate isomerase/epimerase
MEQVKYICPHWGSEDKTASGFINSVVKEGYDGIEINLPDSSFFINEFEENLAALRKWQPDFVFIAQQVLEGKNETVEGYIKRMQQRLEFLVTLQPDFINSHTGKDYFSFDDNCRIIEAAENIAVRSGIPILHETHRGRFTFHAATLLPYLDRFMGMKLVGDFSHWCNVSESMLDDQQHILKRIIPHIGHIHARVGYEHGPQVNDPFATAWKQHLELFK